MVELVLWLCAHQKNTWQHFWDKWTCTWNQFQQNTCFDEELTQNRTNTKCGLFFCTWKCTRWDQFQWGILCSMHKTNFLPVTAGLKSTTVFDSSVDKACLHQKQFSSNLLSFSVPRIDLKKKKKKWLHYHLLQKIQSHLHYHWKCNHKKS